MESFCDTLVEKAVAELGGLDILVNNAGRQQYCESIDDLTTADFDATFKTNVYAPFWITKAALRHLQEGAVIINTTSVQAFKPSAILVDYAQTKACNVAFTKSLAQQLGPRGIRVNAVARSILDASSVQRRPAAVQSSEVRGRYALADRASRLKSHRCMYCLPPIPAHTPPGKCGALTAVPACCKASAQTYPFHG